MVSTYVQKPGLGVLAAYVVVATLLAAGINALIVFSEAAEWTESLKKPDFALTGLQIGLLWEFLFACLALAYWFIRCTPPLPDRRAASVAIWALFLCHPGISLLRHPAPGPVEELRGHPGIRLRRVDRHRGGLPQQQEGGRDAASIGPLAELRLCDRLPRLQAQSPAEPPWGLRAG